MSVALLFAVSALGVFVAAAPAANADEGTGTTLLNDQATYWGPNLNSPTGQNLGPAGTSVLIECYFIGESVTGRYGTEDIWDIVQAGSMVPDADIYTGSNSPVSPSCSSIAESSQGRIIGGAVNVWDYPGDYVVASIPSGEYVAIECYITGPSASGPYGSEDIWDVLFDESYAMFEYVPDAQVYTGSNSATVPEC